MQKFSFFTTNKSQRPDGSLTLEQLLEGIRAGTWKAKIEALRKQRNNPNVYKRLKGNLPGATISALMKTRKGSVPLEQRLVHHTGLIAIDIDKKDNAKLRVVDVVDKEALAQFISPGGEGLKIIYACTPTRDPAIHRRIYDAIIIRLTKLGIAIKLDPIVKSVFSLQYVSYDPEAYVNLKSRLVIRPGPQPRKRTVKPNPDAMKELDEYIARLGKADVTSDYENWLNVMFGLSHTFGEGGREPMHRICRNYKGYSKDECDEKFDACLESGQTSKTPVTIATVFQLLADGMSKPNAKQLQKKYNKSHAVGKVGTAEEVTTGSPELVGLVRFKLFLFNPVRDKKTNEIKDLTIAKLNLNEFERVLGSLGFFRHEKLFIHIQGNIVDVVDVPAILYRVTRYIEQDGDYVFTYRDVEYRFSWEDIAHKWREIRANGTTGNQVSASLPYWQPNLLNDTPTASYVPFQNGVARVTAGGVVVVPYSQLEQQIWRDRILPRAYKLDRTRGMFEEFFINVMGRGDNLKSRSRSEEYKRAVWYYGYMLQGTKRQSTARMWCLYDIKAGNNGRSGKTIIGTAVGHVRCVCVIDGKRTDLTDRFAFQTVRPSTEVIFIDDLDRRASISPIFNMISGTTSADRKGVEPIEKSLKIMVGSNWILEMSGASETGRQFVSQVSDFYKEYAKAHNDTLTPIVDVHGKEFFTDWNDKDWHRFDTFSLRALQTHLKDKPPADTIIGNAAQMRFIQIYEEELFFELCTTLIANAKPGRDGTTIIQGLLTMAVKEHAQDIRKPGIVAKDFLRSLGATAIRNTTVRVGANPKNAWVFPEPLPRLNWGTLRNDLPKFSDLWK